ncbi:glycerol-3-phosphatase [Chitiniphilus shinanonensis]|uniref:Glycerol-3-phosphatase n=1 Tax=Chitiniphilus shinanonensis TaxID=553088 RepID=A0ABQ6BMX6_9NEIS|nr:HAD-IA family hydrolase [Chitiniphilus shinanonensis]GLS03268.1 glycerol-3-phosphatase [Chitiniphilus shinanonensis]
MTLALPATFDALLFDMDGTLIDSTPCVERIWRRWAADIGIEADELIANMHGVRGQDTIQRFAPHVDQEREFKRLLDWELTDLEGTLPVTGILERIAELDGARYGIVTSAMRQLATLKLEYCGLTAPAATVCSEDVARGKPYPDPFLLGAEQLGVDPTRCLAFEDAPSGVRAAKTAGMTVIALTTSHRPDQLAEADLLIGDWRELRFATDGRGGVTVSRA